MFENPVAPGWARDGSFRDPREEGFGPLPENWAKYRGRYVHGGLTILSYSVGDAAVLDLPGSLNSSGIEVITRTLEVAASSQELLLQVAWLKGARAGRLSLDTLRPGGGAAGRSLARLTGDSTIVAGVAGGDPNTSWALDDAEHAQALAPGQRRADDARRHDQRQRGARADPLPHLDQQGELGRGERHEEQQQPGHAWGADGRVFSSPSRAAVEEGTLARWERGIRSPAGRHLALVERFVGDLRSGADEF